MMRFSPAALIYTDRTQETKVDFMSGNKTEDIEKLKNYQKEYGALLANIPLFILVVDKDRRVRKTNDAVLEFVGLPEKAVLGRRGGEVLGCIHHKDTPEGCGFGPVCGACPVKNTVEDTFKTGKNHHKIEANLSFLGDSINERSLLISTAYLESPDKRVLVFLEDITTQKTAEDALRKSEKKYKQLVEDIGPLSLLFMGLPNGKIEYITPSAKKILGFSPEKIIGKSWQNILDWEPESFKSALKYAQKIESGVDHNDFEISFFNGKGERRTLHVISRAIKEDNGRVSYIEGIATDITERRIFEQQQEQINRTLQVEVKKRTAELENINTALKVLLEKQEADKREISEKIYKNYEFIVAPFLQSLKKTFTQEDQLNLMSLLEKNMKEIVGPYSQKLTDPMISLTPAEVQIAAMVKQGFSNKEIAETLKKSVKTISNHRDKIRKKLGLVHKKINLQSYLSSL